MTPFFKSTREALQSLSLPGRRTQGPANAPLAPQGGHDLDTFSSVLPSPSEAQRAQLARRTETFVPLSRVASVSPRAQTDKPLPAPPGLHRTPALYRSRKPVAPTPSSKQSPAVLRKAVPARANANVTAAHGTLARPKPATTPVSVSTFEPATDWLRVAVDVAQVCNIDEDERADFEAELADFFAHSSGRDSLGLMVQMVFPEMDTPDESSPEFRALPPALRQPVEMLRALKPLLSYDASVELLRFFRALVELPALAQSRVFYLVQLSTPSKLAGAMDDLDAVRTLPSSETGALMRQRARMQANDLRWISKIHGGPRRNFLADLARDNPPPLRRSAVRLSVRRQNGANAFAKKGGVSANWDLQTPSD